MYKVEVDSVVSDYGVFENGELKLILNSRKNAIAIMEILKRDYEDKLRAEGYLVDRPFPAHECRNCDRYKKKSCEGQYESLMPCIWHIETKKIKKGKKNKEALELNGD